MFVTACWAITGSLLKKETINGAVTSTMAIIISAIMTVVLRHALSTSLALSNFPAPIFWAAMVAAALVIAVMNSWQKSFILLDMPFPADTSTP